MFGFWGKSKQEKEAEALVNQLYEKAKEDSKKVTVLLQLAITEVTTHLIFARTITSDRQSKYRLVVDILKKLTVSLQLALTQVLTQLIFARVITSDGQLKYRLVADILNDKFALGYIWGSTDAAVQAAGRGFQEFFEYYLLTYSCAFPDETAKAMFAISNNLQKDPEFREGMMLGGNEYLGSASTKPLGGLFKHFVP